MHRPHVITSTSFNAWHNPRYPQQVDAVEKRLRARHLDGERAAPSDYLWLLETAACTYTPARSVRGGTGSHELVYATTLPAGQLVLVSVEFVVEPDDR